MILTKSKFAKHIGRDPAFVTRALKAGRLHGDAVVGEGRSSRIRVGIALQQLGRALDLGQQLRQAQPILPAAPAGDLLESVVADAPADAAEAPPPPAIDAAIELRERNLELRNRKAALEVARGEREAALAAGQLVPAADVSNALRRQAAGLSAMLEEVPPAIAKKISEDHALPYPVLLIAVKEVMRATRNEWVRQVQALANMQVAE